jgi:hypothetical protein
MGLGLSLFWWWGLRGKRCLSLAHWALSHNTMCMLINDISGITYGVFFEPTLALQGQCGTTLTQPYPEGLRLMNLKTEEMMVRKKKANRV